MRGAEIGSGPKAEKDDAIRDLTIHLKGGITAPVPILGGDPATGTSDVYSMFMFLDAVIGDMERRRVSSGGSAPWVAPGPTLVGQPSASQPPAPGMP